MAHPSAPPKRTQLNFRVPDPSVFEGPGFRRSVATPVAPHPNQSATAAGHTAAPVCYASPAPQPRTLACREQAVESAPPGTAKATANPKVNQLQRNYRSGIIRFGHASIAIQ